MYADQSLSPAEARLLESTWQPRVRKLLKTTRLSAYDLQCLSLIFHKMCNNFEWWGSVQSGKTNRLDIVGFRDAMSSLLDITETQVLDNLFTVMDKNNRRYIGPDTFLKNMSILCVGNQHEKNLLCWQAYCPRGEVLTRNQMGIFMKKQLADLGLEDLESMCKEFIDLILKDTKAGKDGFMTLNEYHHIVDRRPLFREFLGQVLPNRLSMETFMATFQPPEVTRLQPFIT